MFLLGPPHCGGVKTTLDFSRLTINTAPAFDFEISCLCYIAHYTLYNFVSKLQFLI
jgi:hypothetical protein